MAINLTNLTRWDILDKKTTDVFKVMLGRNMRYDITLDETVVFDMPNNESCPRETTDFQSKEMDGSMIDEVPVEDEDAGLQANTEFHDSEAQVNYDEVVLVGMESKLQIPVFRDGYVICLGMYIELCDFGMLECGSFECDLNFPVGVNDVNLPLTVRRPSFKCGGASADPRPLCDICWDLCANYWCSGCPRFVCNDFIYDNYRRVGIPKKGSSKALPHSISDPEGRRAVGERSTM